MAMDQPVELCDRTAGNKHIYFLGEALVLMWCVYFNSSAKLSKL